MDENVKDDAKRVMLVQDKEDGKMKAVTDVDKDGNVKTVEPTEGNISILLNVNTQDSGLEAFWKKMLEQAQDPSHTGIFMMLDNVLSKLIKIDLDPEMVEKYRVDPTEELAAVQQRIEGREQPQLEENNVQDVPYEDVIDQQKLDGNGDTGEQLSPEGESWQYQPLDVSKIDRDDLDRKGIKWEDMEPHLNAASHYHKSNQMIPMNPELEPGGERVQTQGRFSLEEQPDGSIKAIPYYHQEKVDLDSPIGLTMLDDTVKKNLAETGHAQQQVMIEFEPGVKTPCYVSVDKLTNGIEVMAVDTLPKVEHLKGVDLTPGQQKDFEEGRKITLEKMTTRAGYYKDAHVQRDAAERGYKFTYDGLDKNRYAVENKAIYEAKKAARENAPEKLTVPTRLKDAPIPKYIQKEWEAALNDPTGKTQIKPQYIKDMTVQDENGQNVKKNLWVLPNPNLGTYKFYQWKPKDDIVKAAQIKPTDNSGVNTKDTLKTGQANRIPPSKIKHFPSRSSTPPAPKQGGGQKV